MKFSERLKFLFRGGEPSKGTANPEPETYVVGELRRGGLPIWLNSRSPALCVATAYRCINLLSTSVANLPLKYKRKVGGIFVEEVQGALPYLLNIEPDPSYNAFDFWRQVEIEVLCSGNAYIIPFYSTISGDWIRLALCARGTVMHDVNTDIYTVSDYENGVFGTFDESQVIHIKGMTGRDAKNGLSVLSYARRTVEIANAGDGEALDRFETGGTVKGLLSNYKGARGFGEYQDKELEKLATKIDVDFSKGTNIVGLPGEVDFKQISLSSADMQFLESRKFTVREICRFFGVHPSFVFDDTSNNYKSAEMANIAFLSNTLNPILRQIENELLRKLVAPGLALKRKFEFDRQGLYTSDLDSKVKYIGAMIGAGLYTVNEARALEDREPVEGGDKVLVSANLKQIDELTSGMTPTSNKNNDEQED